MNRDRWRWVIVAILWMGVFGLNITQLWEAFGSGPPYYGQTTNMDKWENPLPFLILVNLGAVALSAILILPIWQKRNIRRHHHKDAR